MAFLWQEQGAESHEACNHESRDRRPLLNPSSPPANQTHIPVGAQLVAANPNAYMHTNQVSNPTWNQLFPIIRHFTCLANIQTNPSHTCQPYMYTLQTVTQNILLCKRLFLGRHNSCTSTHPKREPPANESNNLTEVQLCEPMSFYWGFYGSVGEGSLPGVGMIQSSCITEKPTPPHVTPRRSFTAPRGLWQHDWSVSSPAAVTASVTLERGPQESPKSQLVPM